MVMFTKPKVAIAILTVIIVIEAVITFNRFSISLNLENRYVHWIKWDFHLTWKFRNTSTHVSHVTQIQKECSQIIFRLLVMILCTLSTIIEIVFGWTILFIPWLLFYFIGQYEILSHLELYQNISCGSQYTL